MWSMWNAPSDRDYYDQDGFSGEEPDTEPEPELVTEEDLAELPDDLSEPPEEEERGKQL